MPDGPGRAPQFRPAGMRVVQHRPSPDSELERMAIGTEVWFSTEHGDVRVKWDANTGRVRVTAYGEMTADQLSVLPLSQNAVSIGIHEGGE